MFALFEEAGKFQTGRILSEAESSSQIELDSGKRVKAKAANILLKFDQPSPADLMREAQAIAPSIELELAWEFAPEDEFGFADLAREYFSERPTLPQQVAALLRLFEAPHYFRRAARGRFRKAPAEILQQALAAIEKKKQVQAQIAAWAAELAAGTCPAPIREQLFKILFKPDKNAGEYKAVVEAARATHLAPLELLQRAGAIASPYQFHWKRFLFENFPKGTAFPALQAPAIRDELPLAPVLGVLGRRFQHHRNRRRAVGAGTGQRDRHGGDPYRRARTGAAAGRPGRSDCAAAAVDRVHAWLQDHDVAGRCGASLHAAGGPRVPRRVALRRFRRDHPRAQGNAHPPRTGADCGQPAARPARRRHHRRVAVSIRHARRQTPASIRRRLCASRCRSCSGWRRT